jgi:hypothetical protein
MRPSTTDDAGFSLVELVVCVGLVLLGAVTALGLVPVLARAANAGIVRAAATDVARNALERARAAAAYAPPALVADPAARSAALADHAWALAPAASFAAAARMRGPLCGNAAGLDVPLAVDARYDAAADRLTVAVSYPRDPCDPGSPSERIVLAATLTPAAYAPGTLLGAPIADPAKQ